MTPKFATAINCIDGRAQVPVLDWVRLNLNVDYVDLITEPGPDKAVSSGAQPSARIIDLVKFSIKAHDPAAIIIAAHHDCLANPASREEHFDMVRRSAKVIESWGTGRRVIGLWVNEWRWVDLICDSQDRASSS